MTDLIRWRPFHRLMRDFFNDLEPFFKESRSVWGESVDFHPGMDIKETDTEVKVMVDLPGMEKDAIEVSVEDGVLAVKGERKGEKRTEENGYVHYERSFGRFERRIRLPEDVEEEKVTAEYKEGVLTITMPRKKVEKPEARKIKIS